MKRKKDPDFQALPLIVGIALGFFLGVGMVYWHFDRQNDKFVAEFFDKYMSNFQDGDQNTDLTRKHGSVANARNKDLSSNRNASVIAEKDFLAKDKLLYSKTITINTNREKENRRKIDSLIGNIYVEDSAKTYYLEFWESPLNSMGYKMGKNKIMLYGIYLFDLAGLSYQNNQLYLHYLNHSYPLEITAVFQPLLPQSNGLVVEQNSSPD
ncbi:MAG: hypothetical protein ACLFQS_06455 [Bacteroidales bacterium]